MSLLKRTASRKTTSTKVKSAGRTAKRVAATAGAAFMLGGALFGLAACGPNENIEVKPEEQTNSQQAQFNELQDQMKQLQNEMNGLKRSRHCKFKTKPKCNFKPTFNNAKQYATICFST